jgi:hypothetical protein
MPPIRKLVEGWTGRITLDCIKNGAALDGTGLTVTAIDLVGSDGTVVDTSGDFGWETQASGVAYYDPDPSDFVASKSPYKVRVQVTDGGGKVVWFPDGEPEQIAVYARGV